MGHGPDLSSPVRSSTQPALSLVGSGAAGSRHRRRSSPTPPGHLSRDAEQQCRRRISPSGALFDAGSFKKWGVSVGPALLVVCPRRRRAVRLRVSYRSVSAGPSTPHTRWHHPPAHAALRPDTREGATAALLLRQYESPDPWGTERGHDPGRAGSSPPPGREHRRHGHVYPPADRPEADVLVDGTWFVGELRMWSHVRMGPGRLT